MVASFLLDLNAFLLGVVLQNQLFQEQKCSFVLDLLPDLHLSLPKMGRVSFLAIITLKIGDNEIYNECLLKISSTFNFLLNSNSDLQSLRVGLGPNKRGVNKFDPLQPFDVLQTERQELRGFGLKVDPRRSLVPIALSAVLKLHRSWYTLGDINS